MTEIDHRAFYASEAANYEATRYGSRYGRMFRSIHRSAVAGSLQKAHKALDVATGTGQMLPVLASAAERVVASDLTPAMLREAQQGSAPQGRINFCVGDATRLPYRDGAFDLVTSSRFLHLFEPAVQSGLVGEMARVLCSGGTLVVDFYSADARRMFGRPIALYRKLLRKRPENDFRVSIRDAREMMRASGLRITRIQGLGNFMLVPLLWLPLAWLTPLALWLGRSFPRLSEQFLVVARKQ